MTTSQDSLPLVTPGTKITEGIVIGLDFGAWAGFTSGRITLRGEDEGRKEFHYGQYAKGVVPDI
ncbi:MAG: hypothetical protein ACFFED_17185, partial [Candidatus Thorarchaeota archaeon]